MKNGKSDTQNSNPLVSIVMATYNDGPEKIKEAIESILNQSYAEWELLVLDDSTDEATRQVIDSYADHKKISVVRERGRMGFVYALNKGLELAEGKYIARMDGDDISFPERLEIEVAYLEKNSDVAVVGGQVNIINGNGDIVSKRRYPVGWRKILIFMAFRSPLAHPAVMFRKKLVNEGLKYNTCLGKAEDIDFWLKIVNAGYKIGNVPETLLNYRVDGPITEKRGSLQWENNLKVRKENFSFRHLVVSVVSVLIAWIYTIVPDCIKNWYYRRENRV